MSLGSYDKQVTHKYRLMVAIAVLNTKPEELSIEQFINVIKTKENMNTTQFEIENITVSSEDFNFDLDVSSDEVNINYTENYHTLIDSNASYKNSVDFTKTYTKATDSIDIFSKNDENRTKNIDGTTILKDLDTGMKFNEGQHVGIFENNLDDVLSVLRDIDGNIVEKTTTKSLNLTQDTLFENSEQTPKTNENTDYSSYVYRDETSIQNDAGNICLQSKDVMHAKITSAIIKNLNKEVFTNKDPIHNDTPVKRTNGNLEEVDNDIRDPKRKKIEEMKRELSINIDQDTKRSIKKDNNSLAERICRNLDKNTNTANVLDSQETVFYTVPGVSQNCTHISQSQSQNLQIKENYISRKTSGIINRIKLLDNNSSAEQTANDLDRHTDGEIETDARAENTSAKLTDDNQAITNAIDEQKPSTSKDIGFQRNGSNQISESNSNFESNPNPNSNHDNGIPIQNTQVLSVQCTEIEYVIDKNGKAYRILDKINYTQNAKQDSSVDVNGQVETVEDLTKCSDDDMETNFQNEVVPMKVVKELNKVKMLLNRINERGADGVSTDSGYRSDSQKTNRNVFESQGTWLNQSAHCISSFLLTCPLVTITDEITKEISQVLGKLIDRLHEEENYPSFLDEILQKIETFLQRVFEEESSGENLLKKEETLHRLFLLNKSFHLMKFTIEKLTIILEEVHEKFTAEDSLYEIENIQETENITYIFYILEILLKRYVKMKDNYSQSQPSQDEDKLLKKSSITDIWRKKWNPKYKENKILEGSSQKTCVLSKCMDILNIIIVDCMEGYSLVSFAALQCFNLLQS